MRKVLKITALCTALTLLTGCVNVTLEPEEPEKEVTKVEPARPQDDFYRFINEETLKTLSFDPGASNSDGPYSDKQIKSEIKGIIKEVASGSGYEKGTEEDIIKTAYDLFSAYDFENSPVPAELDGLLKEIDSVSDLSQLLKIDAKLQKDYGVGNLFNITVDTDYFSQGDLILSFAQYQNIMNTSFSTLDEDYAPLNSIKKSASAYYRALGHDKESADKAGTELGHIVMDIYNSTDRDTLDSDTPYTFIKTLSFDEVDSILSEVDLKGYLEDLSINPADCQNCAVVDTEQLKSLNDMLTEDNLEALKAWEMTALGTTYKRFIAHGYDALKDYEVIDYESEENQVLNEIYDSFYQETDPLYVEKYYSEETDNALISMCDAIKDEYRTLIGAAAWLTEETRQGLLNKLEKIVYVTGTNLKRHDPAEYADLSGKDYFEYSLAYTRKTIKKQFERLGNKADRSEVRMPMQMMNACYDPSLNNITITVAITNKPFFDADADFYTNLGGLGMVIAHEMGHAFDSNCILFTEDGVYDPSWVAEADTEILKQRNEKAATYFEDNFTVLHVYHVNGQKTLGENYADLGAMECITSIPKTKEERVLLFENFARIWCGKKTEDALISQLDVDVHSPETIRVNAILSTVDAFYETYDVKEGDGMYIAADKRISRWH